jgi:hypothetical protein
MAQNGFIDHGFYSAIIVLKWYGFLIQSARYKPEYFFYPVVDSASAILLHNYYKNAIMKPPFELGSLAPHDHPIAYLLMLCDELQEWNREAYGIDTKKSTLASDANFTISDTQLEVTYITENSSLPGDFGFRKQALLSSLLHLESIFADGLSVLCETRNPLAGKVGERLQALPASPRPLLDNLEKLAIAIHENYNQKQVERNPDKPLAYPEWSNLPDSLKYSNLRQARGITAKLEFMGWEMRPMGSEGEVIKEITGEALELLSFLEHEDWIRERLTTGWVYGEEKDTENKISPYLVPYHELKEEIKEYDRDSVRNIPALLSKIKMAIYVKEKDCNKQAANET